jgi:adenosylhomocysteine nucleosidase
VISDESNFEIPEMDRFIDAQGRFRTVSFVGFIALRPWLWRRVAMLAGNSRKAARALGEHLERWVQVSQVSEPVAATSESHAGGTKRECV